MPPTPAIDQPESMNWSGPRGRRPDLAGRTGISVLGLVLAAALGGACLSACAGGSPPDAAPTTAVASGSGSTTGGTPPSSGPLTAYRSMWADLVSAARTSNFQSTRLAQHASGQVLTLFVQGLARDQLHDIVTRGEPALHPVVTSSSPSRATVVDCFDDTHWLEYKTSGGLAKNAPGGPRATTATVVKMSGTWKVTQLTVGKAGSC
jgi:hypothetical protein